MTDNSPSKEMSRNKWRAFKRAEAAMWHASAIFRGTGDIDGAITAARKIREYFDDAYEDAKVIADAGTRLRAEERMKKQALQPPRDRLGLPKKS